MDFIIDSLYLGDNSDAKKLIRERSIEAVINVSHYENHKLPRKSKIKYFKIGIRDSKNTDSNLHLATYLVLDYCMKNNFKTLIHCSAGRSRSASYVILYLMVKHGMNYDQAINYIKERRRITDKRFKKIILSNYERLKLYKI